MRALTCFFCFAVMACSGTSSTGVPSGTSTSSSGSSGGSSGGSSSGGSSSGGSSGTTASSGSTGSGKTCGTRGAAPCAEGEWCAYPPDAQCGAADAPGACEKKPTGSTVCIDLYDPVCGCDGKTYGNECEAHGAMASVATKGECTK